MAKTQYSFGRLLLQIALGAMLVVGGIWALTGGGDFGCVALKAVFSGSLLKTLKIVFGVIELLAGAFLIIELFAGDIFGKIDNILMMIIWIVWIVAIVLGDFLGGSGLFKAGFSWEWLYGFAAHLIVLGAMLNLND
ncbi:MAG: hypothetical protein J6X37_04920 [Treponema sp.]|uniref:hypothetical protein n=1 Tax=Treponema sp. TaxID=166 RepID=UPI001B6FB36A|nr:hypothetical protein [Treponema sp.]MBP5588049.1 hypothetical protein [Treponema sp.]MCR5386720.1 hypothetical protein [Treponema sp.]